MSSIANLILIVVVFLGIAFSCTAEKRPNIIFLVVESPMAEPEDGYQMVYWVQQLCQILNG